MKLNKTHTDEYQATPQSRLIQHCSHRISRGGPRARPIVLIKNMTTILISQIALKLHSL